MIEAPTHPKVHPDRDSDCRDALEPAFQALRTRAEELGWSAGEVARALLALSTALIKARIGRAAIDRARRAAGEMRRSL